MNVVSLFGILCEAACGRGRLLKVGTAVPLASASGAGVLRVNETGHFSERAMLVNVEEMEGDPSR